MRVYTVHIHPRRRDADSGIVLVKEGFSWPAFFFSVIWALWHGLWLVALLFLAVEIALGFVFDLLLLRPLTQSVLAIAAAVAIGAVANDLRRWTLAGRGFRPAGVVVARDLLAAERRWFENHSRLAPEAPA